MKILSDYRKFFSIPSETENKFVAVRIFFYALLIFITGMLCGILYMEIRYQKILWFYRNSKLSGLEINSANPEINKTNLEILSRNLEITKTNLEMISCKLKIDKTNLEIVISNPKIIISNLKIVISNSKIVSCNSGNLIFLIKTLFYKSNLLLTL